MMQRLPPLDRIPADLVAAVDYQRQARHHLDDPVWAYLQGGAADELTVAANQAAYREISLLPRVLAEVSGGNTHCRMFGETFEHPLFLAPVAYQKLFHPAGELATALGAGAMAAPLVLSTLASCRLEDVAATADGPLWFQLYWQGSRAASLALLERAAAAGYRAIVLTVDAPLAGVRNREQRVGFALPPGISAVNVDNQRLPAVAPGGSTVFSGLMGAAPTWGDLEWLVARTALPVLVKGLLHPADARLAVAAGAQGIVVSNHGGRVLDTTPATLSVLPAIRAVVGETLPVLVDGGIQRGTDVFKAIALGASAVLLGRPYIHALATAGALGVAHLLRILREELEATMALCGCPELAAISRDHLLLP